MPDREKVIKGLETCIKPGTRGCFHNLGVCPYDGHGCRQQMETDALALLKEQEAEIRQLRLALDIAKGTCKGIAVETDEKFMGDL